MNLFSNWTPLLCLWKSLKTLKVIELPSLATCKSLSCHSSCAWHLRGFLEMFSQCINIFPNKLYILFDPKGVRKCCTIKSKYRQYNWRYKREDWLKRGWKFPLIKESFRHYVTSRFTKSRGHLDIRVWSTSTCISSVKPTYSFNLISIFKNHNK